MMIDEQGETENADRQPLFLFKGELPPGAFCFSENTGKILTALSKAQAKFPIIKKSDEVDFTHNNRRTNYSYADLAKFVRGITPFLSENELSVLHDCRTVAAGCSASTFLGHSSGQWIKSAPIVIRPAGDGKPQTTGSAMTYARRYSITSFLNLVSEEDDDDAMAAAGVAPGKEIPFGSTDHLTLAAELMTAHGMHKDDRKQLLDWLIAKNHNPERRALSTTIGAAAKKALEKRSADKQ